MTRRRLDFSDVQPIAGDVPLAIGSLCFSIPTKDKREYAFDFTALPGTPLVHRMVVGLELWLRSCRWKDYTVLSPGRRVTVFTAMLRLLHDRGLRHVHEIDVAAHDAVEAWLFATYTNTVARDRLRWFQEPLRRLDDDEKHPALAARLAYLTHRAKTPSQPRDAYSPRVRSALRKACLREMQAVVTRLTTEADRVLAAAQDPRAILDPADAKSGATGARRTRTHGPRARSAPAWERRSRGWLSPTHVAWELTKRGPMSLERLAERSGYSPGSLSNTGVLRDAVRSVFPTHADLIPFQLYIQLRTGMPPSSLHDLTTDCLEPTREGRANLRYYKGRARRNIVYNVGTETLADAGGAIKAVLAITARLREHVSPADQDKLWLHIHSTNFGEVLTNGGGRGDFPYDAFVRRHGVTDDDGRPLRIVESRLRKSFKADVAEATGGRLDAIAQDNSRGVAAKHYGDIPALRPLHEQTMEEAAQDALMAAIAVTVVTAEDEVALAQAEPPAQVRERGISPSRVLAVLQHPEEHDVFLSGCLNFFDSPFAKRPGDPCPVATWRCLECANAVVTKRHLPRLLRFANHLLRERDHLGEEVWRLKYGQAHELLHAGILPRFPEAAIDAARAIASADDDLRWLPPEMRSSLLTAVPPHPAPAA